MFDLNLDPILTQLQCFINTSQVGSGKVWVAYSGGLDSTVLLHALSELNRQTDMGAIISAVHVDHGLSDSHLDWASHCRYFASSLGVDFRLMSVVVATTGKGVENAAREARYQAFASLLADGDRLFLGHHLNDQAETLMYRLMRGTGLSGLLGMAKRRKFVGALIERPWLDVTRQVLEQYAIRHNLRWIEDESNRSEKFDRNYLRLNVLPVLMRRWPDLLTKIAQTQQWLSEAGALLDEYAGQDLVSLGRRPERLGQSLDLAYFKRLSLPRQKHVLRVWTSKCGYLPPSAAQLKQLSGVLGASGQTHPKLVWGTCELQRFNGRLYLLPRLTDQPNEVLGVELNSVVLRYGVLSGIPEAVRADLSVVFRRGGERCKPKARAHSQTLKKLLQEVQLEPWLRDKVPLIYYHNELLAVADLFVCEVAHKNPPDLASIEWKLGLSIEN